VRAREHLLQHEGVHKYHAVLQQVQVEHAQLVVVGSIAAELAAAAEEHEVVGAVPVLDHVQPVVDLAPKRLVREVRTQKAGLDRLPEGSVSTRAKPDGMR